MAPRGTIFGGSPSRSAGGGEPSPRTWHATVFLGPNELELTVLNSSNHLTRKLCRSGLDVFRDMIQKTGKSPGLSISCRRAWYYDPGSSYKGQRISHTDDPFLVMPATLDAHARDSCAMLLKAMLERLLDDKRWRTELQVRQAIPRGKALVLPAKKQVGLLAAALQPLYRILELLLAV